jgi:hypothetical protein
MRTTSHTVRLARAALCLAAASLAACTATGGAPGNAAALRAGPTAGYDRARDHLEVAEMQGASAQTALDLVRKLRPEYLRPEASSRAALGAAGGRGAPVVYVDGNRWGGPDALGSIPAYLVAEIRRVPAYEARTRYGLVDPSPVIDVRLLRRK